MLELDYYDCVNILCRKYDDVADDYFYREPFTGDLHENKDIKITKPESETDVPFLEFLLNIFSNKTNDSNISKFNISGENSRINSNKNSLNNSSNNHSNSDNSKFIVDIIGFGCWFWYRL
ncbi:hypothetical protein HYD94_03635 [Mycoplasmopsis bovis]|nr:hypothetical protein [Mycoplasmopsis bovis]QQH20051.1 hypothetical protein HYE44_03520 [Mycoplasmopsis bovis]QQH24664.1 hypothetical protein HYE20_03540 [Mycoplasmopsis bovis]QQH25164.1 hypothetical protein HYE18_03720 [Mycoplasmopsis bovis]QQH25650.1 hypothetical protein HYE15_03535 [Mycoplasmopsis bovis]QQH27405.1 hypothetical protein HYE07_03530 [Mycoplasmopsis bovis]